MSTNKDSVLTTKVESSMKAAFMAIAASKHRPASQILRDLIRLYVESHTEGQEIPNIVTLSTLQKSARGEEVFTAKNASDLFRQLDI